MSKPGGVRGDGASCSIGKGKVVLCHFMALVIYPQCPNLPLPKYYLRVPFCPYYNANILLSLYVLLPMTIDVLYGHEQKGHTQR